MTSKLLKHSLLLVLLLVSADPAQGLSEERPSHPPEHLGTGFSLLQATQGEPYKFPALRRRTARLPSPPLLSETACVMYPESWVEKWRRTGGGPIEWESPLFESGWVGSVYVMLLDMRYADPSLGGLPILMTGYKVRIGPLLTQDRPIRRIDTWLEFGLTVEGVFSDLNGNPHRIVARGPVIYAVDLSRENEDLRCKPARDSPSPPEKQTWGVKRTNPAAGSPVPVLFSPLARAFVRTP